MHEHQKIEKLIVTSYQKLRSNLPTIKAKISDNQIDVIIATAAKMLQKHVNQSTDAELSILTDYIWKTIENHAGDLYQKRANKVGDAKTSATEDEVVKLFKPVVGLAELRNLFDDLAKVTFKTAELKKLPEHFAKNYTPNSQLTSGLDLEQSHSPIFNFLVQLHNQVHNLKNALGEDADHTEEFDYLFGVLIRNSAAFNPPSDDIIYKLGLLVKTFKGREPTHHYLLSLQKLCLTQKAYDEEVNQVWSALREKTNQNLPNFTLPQDHALLQSYNAVTSAITAKPADFDAMYQAFNNFTAQAHNTVDGDLFPELKKIEEVLIDAILLKGYDFWDPIKTKENTDRTLAKLVTIEHQAFNADLDKIIQNRKNQIVSFRNEIIQLITQCYDPRFAFQKDHFVNEIWRHLEVENDEEARKLLRSTARSFAQYDKRYNVKIGKTVRDEKTGKIIETHDARLLRDENIAEIFRLRNENFPKVLKLHEQNNLLDQLKKENAFPATHKDQLNARTELLETLTDYILETRRKAFAQVTQTVEESVVHHVAQLNEQKIRIMRVISRVQEMGKELSKDPQRKDKGEKLIQLATDLTKITNDYYHTVTLDKQDQFKANLVSLVTNTFNSVGNHRREWAKQIEMVIVNALFSAFSLVKGVVTGQWSWFMTMNTSTQNSLLDAKNELLEEINSVSVQA